MHAQLRGRAVRRVDGPDHRVGADPRLNTAANTSNTVIYIQYGDASATSAQNVNGTWDTSFTGVWHLNQTTSTQTDSTSTRRHAATGTRAHVSDGLRSARASTPSGTTGTGYFDSRRRRSTRFGATRSPTRRGSRRPTTYGPILSQRKAGRQSGHRHHGRLRRRRKHAPAHCSRSFVTTRATPYAEVTAGRPQRRRLPPLRRVTRERRQRRRSTSTAYSSGIGDDDGRELDHHDGEALPAHRQRGQLGCTIEGQAAPRTGTSRRRSTSTASRTSLARATGSITDYNTQSAPASTFSAGVEAGTACGNGTLDSGEACDDGNLLSGDGCSAACAIETGITAWARRACARRCAAMASWRVRRPAMTATACPATAAPCAPSIPATTARTRRPASARPAAASSRSRRRSSSTRRRWARPRRRRRSATTRSSSA